MKKLLVIALALFTLNGMAQEKDKRSDRKDRSERRMEMTPSDIADLKSKKLTLKLDLTEAQQKEVHALLLSEAKANEGLRKKRTAVEGEKKEKPSKEEFIKMQNLRLDQQIEMKREMKTILNAEQYAKFEKMKPREHKKRGHRNKKQDQKRDKQHDEK
ncbi:hypothetical protein [Winogradskyella thalassocola]|uniref:LTXXQ motif family protein n=1 Tax=Winogradskyella thalassocola TaxID=262004 RepID=A0A1G8K8Z2_9FLAO|nr:hypothetical protein [Winogradskyella thalassocola]SDI39827.1 hypothetical protein SAMN04489796_110106 [Winogradskyella thalassocola]